MGNGYGTFIALFVAIAACFVLLFGLPRPDTIGTPYAEFREQWALWDSRRPDSYEVHVERSCFCFSPWSVRTTVETGAVERLQHDGDGPDPSDDYSDRIRYPRTVDEVFRTIDRFYREKAYRIDIQFDDAYGFPRDAYIDREGQAIDDEVGFRLGQLVVVNVG